MKETKVSNLKINKLTRAQYQAALAAGNISDTELYMTIDGETTQDILTQNPMETSQDISFDDTSNYYTIAPTAATTFTFPSGLDSAKVYTFELKVTLNPVISLTFPNSVKWLNDEAPDMSEIGVYFLAFRTDDGGNTWYGNLQGRWS